MDDLEKYIESNREEFNSEEPRPEVWDRIKDAVKEEVKTISISSWIWKAAAIVLLATTTFLAVDKWQQPDTVQLTDQNESSFTDEFDNAERYYLGQIEEMQSQLTKYTTDEQINSQFMMDLQNLDSLYNGLKTEFEVSGNNEKVADALIQNLRIRMEIINQQLMILERIKRQTSDDNIQI